MEKIAPLSWSELSISSCKSLNHPPTARRFPNPRSFSALPDAAAPTIEYSAPRLISVFGVRSRIVPLRSWLIPDMEQVNRETVQWKTAAGGGARPAALPYIATERTISSSSISRELHAPTDRYRLTSESPLANRTVTANFRESLGN